MNTPAQFRRTTLRTLLGVACITTAFAQGEPKSSPIAAAASVSGQPSEAEMMKQMMELTKLNDNHKLLAGMAGTWTYTVKMWMASDAPPTTSTGTAVREAVMDGRYVTGKYTGKMSMPGADGKMIEMPFTGMSLDGYDNVKKKFVSSWVDNMGTGIMLSEGTYDLATKAFTYIGSYEPIPGMTTKIREVIKMTDNDHQTLEYYEDRGGKEAKTMEIISTRKK